MTLSLKNSTSSSRKKMSKDRWYQVPSDLSPRLHIEGGPCAGKCHPDFDPNTALVLYDQLRGHYVKYEVRGGVYWQWTPNKELPDAQQQ